MDEEGTRFDAALFGSRAFAGESLRRPRRPRRRRRDDLARGAARPRSLARAPGRGEPDRRDRCLPRAARRAGAAPRGDRRADRRRSPRSSACAATACRCAGRRTTRARRRWHCGETPSRAPHGSRSSSGRPRAAASTSPRTSAVSRVAPGGANVVPGFAEFTIDVRAPTAEGVAELERLVEEIVERIAREEAARGRARADLRPRPARARRGAWSTAIERAAAEEGASVAPAAERRRPRRDGDRAPRSGRDDLRPEPRRHQPLAGRVQLARRGRAGDARPRGNVESVPRAE